MKLEKSIKTSKNLTDNNQPYVNSNLAYSEPNEKIGIYASVGSIIIVFLLVSLA